MTDVPTSKPAWQTDELEDEWMDENPASVFAHDKSDLSYTNLVGSILVKKEESDNFEENASTNDNVGTFLIREDVAATPFLPKTPGKSKKNMFKGFFSPLALEMMFEPPSPPSTSTPLPPPVTSAPVVPSRLSQMYVPSEEPSEAQSEGDIGVMGIEEEDEQRAEDDKDERDTSTHDHPREEMNYQFTFAPPEPSPFNPTGTVPNAQSTPIPPRA